MLHCTTVVGVAPRSPLNSSTQTSSPPAVAPSSPPNTMTTHLSRHTASAPPRQAVLRSKATQSPRSKDADQGLSAARLRGAAAGGHAALPAKKAGDSSVSMAASATSTPQTWPPFLDREPPQDYNWRTRKRAPRGRTCEGPGPLGMLNLVMPCTDVSASGASASKRLRALSISLHASARGGARRASCSSPPPPPAAASRSAAASSAENSGGTPLRRMTKPSRANAATCESDSRATARCDAHASSSASVEASA